MQQILFVSLSNIGDAIMTTPALERLHQLYPEAVIDLVLDPRSQLLFQHCPYRGEIFLKIKKQGNKGLIQLIKKLRKKRYDLIVDLRTDGLAYLLRAQKRLTKWGRKPYGAHAVEDIISIIHQINPDKRIPDTKIWVDRPHIEEAEKLTSGLVGKRWLALGPGANWPPKIWPSANFAQVANALKDKVDAVVIVGGPGDTDYCDQTAKQLDLPTLNLSGKTDLLTSAAILRDSKLFIGNDSGLGHLASAVGTPCISIFGPGQPERYRPWSKDSIYFQGDHKQFDEINIHDVISIARQKLS